MAVTNLATSKEALSAYKKRMWIEGMFADFKGHGFDLESTRLRSFGKLSRLSYSGRDALCLAGGVRSGSGQARPEEIGGANGSTGSQPVSGGLQHAGSMFGPRDQAVYPLTSELFTKTVWWLVSRPNPNHKAPLYHRQSENHTLGG